jgi:DNA primase
MNNLLSLLSVVIGNPGRNVRKDNEHIFFCPFCSHYKPKLQVNLVSQFWHCWVCDSKGRTLKQLFYKLNATPNQFIELTDIVGETYYYSEKSDIVEVISLPKEYIPLWKNEGNRIIRKHALLYLKRRNISIKDIIKYEIGFCEEGLYRNRIVIPSYDNNNKLNYFIARNFYKGGMKYKNPPVSKNVIMFENHINWNLPIVICEGAFDAITIKRNVIPILGKTLPEALLEKMVNGGTTRVIIILDTDARKDALKMTEKLARYSIDSCLVKLTDKDPSEEGFDNMINYINGAKNIDLFNTIKMKLEQI